VILFEKERRHLKSSKIGESFLKKSFIKTRGPLFYLFLPPSGKHFGPPPPPKIFFEKKTLHTMTLAFSTLIILFSKMMKFSEFFLGGPSK
jgi:hypothetical protein